MHVAILVLFVHDSASDCACDCIEPDVAAFLGIPYAEKPIGQNRFLPPKPVAAWTQPLEATKVGSVCAQLPANGLVRLPVLPGTEDCL